jgi:hypothetical protein
VPLLDVNSDAVVKFSNKLDKLGKSALPNAVRETLSKAALDVKQRTMPHQAKSEFVQRTKTFFKANSRVEFAKGKDIDSMRSVVGFTEHALRGSDNYAVDDLQQQEYGGTIGGKSFIPQQEARVSKSVKKNVRANFRIEKLRNLKSVSDAPGKNWADRFFKTALHVGVGGMVLSTSGRSGAIYRIDSIEKGRIKKTKLYSFSKNRTVKVSGTGFMGKASAESADSISHIYLKEAQKQIDRYFYRK